MSESEEHKNLVVTTARKIQQLHPHMWVLMDIQDVPGTPIPPLIRGHRPDIIARPRTEVGDIIIAEAKTSRDVDNAHTLSQVKAFIGYLRTNRHGTSTFVLTVGGAAGARDARNLLSYVVRRYVTSRLHVHLFDGLDFWILGGPKEELWRLY